MFYLKALWPGFPFCSHGPLPSCCYSWWILMRIWWLEENNRDFRSSQFTRWTDPQRTLPLHMNFPCDPLILPGWHLSSTVLCEKEQFAFQKTRGIGSPRFRGPASCHLLFIQRNGKTEYPTNGISKQAAGYIRRPNIVSIRKWEHFQVMARLLKLSGKQGDTTEAGVSVSVKLSQTNRA